MATSERTIFDGLTIGWFILAAATFVALLFVSAPYGRHSRSGWGYTLSSKAGWLLMETPAALVFAACFVLGESRNSITAWIFFALWEAHYIHRAFIYPLHRRDNGKRMPILVASMGFLFNAFNGYLNGRYIYGFSGGYPNEWLKSPQFLLGLSLFIVGFIVNREADQTLRSLRQPGETGYKLPRGGLYRWICCPNYFGEIVEWVGWAIATWALPTLAFAVWTAANLVPRARTHHVWYRERFPDYPPKRKALLPGIW